MSFVAFPLTGAGDATAKAATDLIGDEHYQRLKIFDGTEGSTVPIIAKLTTPGSADPGMVVRPIGSTAFNQAVVGSVGLTSGSSAVELTSAGSTRLAGRFTVENPTTAVDLSSGGSTRVIGTVNATGTTKVDVSSGVILGAGSSANMLGQVYATGTTKVDVSSGVILGAGSSANIIGSVVNTSGSTAAILGAVVLASGSTAFLAGAMAVSSGVILGAGSSANTLGAVAQAPGSTSIAPWYVISSAGAGGSTTVDANLTSLGSTRSVGTVNQGSAAGTSADAWWVRSVTSAGGTTTVDANLSSAGSTRIVGTVNVSSGLILGGSTQLIGLISSGTQTIGTVDISSAGSTRIIGTVDARLTSDGSTRFVGMNNYESFTITSRTSVASSADIALFTSSTAHRVRIVQNQATATELLLNLSTVAVTSASTGSDIRIQANAFVVFGGQTGDFPLYVGPIRCKVASTIINSVAIGITMSS